MNPVVHFEMSASNMKRMKAFYTNVFGWKMEETGPDMGGYVVVNTTETGKDGRPKVPGNINGGFYLRTKDAAIQYPSVVISVKDIHKAIQDVRAAGGKVEMEPQEIPGIGLFVSMFDTEGNRVSLLQPKGM